MRANRQTERREESKQQIIASAFEIIAREGFDKLSLSAAGINAGYSRELPRYLFGSKDEFIGALIDDVSQTWSQEFAHQSAKSLDGMALLLSVTARLKSLYTRDSNFRGRLALIFSIASSNNATLRKQMFNAQNRLTKALEKTIETGIKDKSMRADINVKAAATLIQGAHRGISYQWLMEPESLSLNKVFRELEALMTHALAN